jgi:asparagine synthase (glutamine-hydrolysing)
LRGAGVFLRDHSDTEVLFQPIRRVGLPRAVERIDGVFAFAFRDGASGTLYLVRYLFGEKPLYWGPAQGRLVLASEVSALRCHPALCEAGLDRQAAYDLLLFEYLPGTASGWSGIEKARIRQILTFADGRISCERYWRPRIASRPVDLDAAVEQLRELSRQSVRRLVVADVPVGVFLSGGVDWSLVAALAAETAPDLTAFTVRVGGRALDSTFDETPHAIAVARHLRMRHQVVELDAADLADAFDAASASS